MKKQWSLLILFTCLAFSCVPFAASSNTISLYVTVIEPDYNVFTGVGYLHIEDQIGWGKAALYVPVDHVGPVKIEIYRRNQVVASWMWGIKEHTAISNQYRRFEYTLDTYVCEDPSGRDLTVYIHGYYWDGHQNIYAISFGPGAGFEGKLK